MKVRVHSFAAALAVPLLLAAPAAAQQASTDAPQAEAAAEDQPPAEAEEAPIIAGGDLAPAPEREPREPQSRPAAAEAAPSPQQEVRPTARSEPQSGATGPAAAGPAAAAEASPAQAEFAATPTDPIPPEDAPPPVAATDVVPPAADERQNQGGGAAWLWLLAGVVLTLGGLALYRLLSGRRASGPEVVSHHESVAAMGAAAGAAAAAEARPWVELSVRPFRAGVEGEAAIVEFELAVDNQGAAPARDVRVSTWMFPGGAEQQTEMERMLIEQPPAGTLPGVSLDPGEMRRIATAVALPTAAVGADAVLPVLVADARYTLPDGSEGRTAVSFAVGMRDGEELAHFATSEPSGLHGEVEARPLGEPERV